MFPVLLFLPITSDVGIVICSYYRNQTKQNKKANASQRQPRMREASWPLGNGVSCLGGPASDQAQLPPYTLPGIIRSCSRAGWEPREPAPAGDETVFTEKETHISPGRQPLGAAAAASFPPAHRVKLLSTVPSSAACALACVFQNVGGLGVL